MKYLIAVILISLLCSAGARADALEIIQLNNRSADEIIPIVSPLMKPGEALSGTGFKLILRASPGTVSEIRRILSQIDAGLKNLVVSVDHAGSARTEQAAAGAGVRYGTIEGGTVSGYVGHGQSTNQSIATQRIRVIEGQPAWINAGQVFLVPGTAYARGGVVVSGALQREAGTGFYVVPRVAGDRVNLEIASHRESLVGAGPTLDVQSANTVVTGAVGEWIDIGGIVQSGLAGQRGILSGAQSSGERTDNFRVRVDIAE